MEAKTLTLVERLKVVIRGAYNEGFSEGMREHTSHKGGKIWQESSASTHAEELASLLEAAEKALEPFALTLGAMEKRAPGFHEVQPDNRALDIEVCYGTIRLARSVHSKLKGVDPTPGERGDP